MAHTIEEGLKPGGFESHTRSCPQDPQADYKATEPIMRDSHGDQYGHRESAAYPQKMPVPVTKQGNEPSSKSS